MFEIDATVRVHIWLESEHKAFIGLGRASLLRRIQETGSLKGAAESLNMSYRAAWGKIRQSEETLGRSLLVARGGRKSGHELTPFAVELIQAFETWFDMVEQFANESALNVFRSTIHPFINESNAKAEIEDSRTKARL
jgi:molybdate transport system regulatory protein